jgi:hypothetical protein
MDDSKRDLLRHTLATLAYRGGKTVRGAPETFASFRVAEKTRTPVEILAHIGDLLDWALSLVKGKQAWNSSQPLPWDQEVQRFHAGLAALDAALLSGGPAACPAEKLFQGPIADALTHIGQIAMLRRLAGSPVRPENYFQAEITAGRVGADQAPPAQEF